MPKGKAPEALNSIAPTGHCAACKIRDKPQSLLPNGIAGAANCLSAPSRKIAGAAN
ncbi:MAG TPA: hypothetical protein PLY70_01150 [Saprospiraceae bacterium]|nr:hypothetical protein [Saprospiraceae bacterium]HPN68183.1 hypothetical protein [Saprospiraceae bacterium]